MKKFDKIQMQNAFVFEEREMKSICGGSGESDYDTHGSTCSGTCFVSGTLLQGSCTWIEVIGGGAGNGYRNCGCVRIVN